MQFVKKYNLREVECCKNCKYSYGGMSCGDIDCTKDARLGLSCTDICDLYEKEVWGE